MTAPEIEIRPLRGLAEFRAAEDLQREIWGEGDQPDPADLMMVVAEEGGLVAGAFDRGLLLGYLFAFPTRDPAVQHSHRLGVRAAARGLKLGQRLKWFQRDWGLAHGVSRVRWTYDPLRLPNATLNIAVLGAEVATYLPDYYGEIGGINAGTPSDRVMAEWHLAAPSVQARREGGPAPVSEGARRISLPADFAAMVRDDPQAALDLRLQTRAALTAAFAEGLAIRGFDRGQNSYLLWPRAGSDA